ncbi:MAG: NUDIX domain-containing protein [Nocardioides sp.]
MRRFVVVPATYVYLFRTGSAGDEVLLGLRRNTGFMDGHWAAAAAGHIEDGESAYRAAIREAAEEIGVDPVLDFATTQHRRHSPAPVDQRIDIYFTARSWTGEPAVQEPAKCAGLRWFSLTELPDPMPPHERHVLAGLATGTLAPFGTFGF